MTIRVLIDKGTDFEPPPGTKVVAGTAFRDVTELVLVVPDRDSTENREVHKARPDTHHVRCPSCSHLFDFFAATSCGHRPRPSKLCPHCDQCACADTDYADPRFWREAPPIFQKHGIRELFVRYL